MNAGIVIILLNGGDQTVWYGGKVSDKAFLCVDFTNIFGTLFGFGVRHNDFWQHSNISFTQRECNKQNT